MIDACVWLWRLLVEHNEICVVASLLYAASYCWDRTRLSTAVPHTLPVLPRQTSIMRSGEPCVVCGRHRSSTWTDQAGQVLCADCARQEQTSWVSIPVIHYDGVQMTHSLRPSPVLPRPEPPPPPPPKKPFLGSHLQPEGKLSPRQTTVRRAVEKMTASVDTGQVSKMYRPPEMTDDRTDGYLAGQWWLDMRHQQAYLLLNDTEGHARWRCVDNIPFRPRPGVCKHCGIPVDGPQPFHGGCVCERCFFEHDEYLDQIGAHRSRMMEVYMQDMAKAGEILRRLDPDEEAPEHPGALHPDLIK